MAGTEGDPYTAISIKKQRLYGLKLRSKQVKPRTSFGAYLDDILEKAGIPEITEKEFKKYTGVGS